MKPDDAAVLSTWLLFALTSTALLAIGLWFLRPRAHRWELPPQRLRAVPWQGAEILGLFALVELFWPALTIELLRGIGFFDWFYGPTFSATLQDAAHPDAQMIARIRVGIWARTVAFPLSVVTGPLLLAACRGARPYQLGLHAHRLGRNLLTGVLAWMTFTPFLTLLWLTLVWLLARMGQAAAEDHPLTQLGRQSPLASDRVLLVFTAVIAAPVIEELLFRGTLQPWLNTRSRPQASDEAPLLAVFRFRSFRQGLIMGLSVFWAALGRADALAKAWQANDRFAFLAELAPALFIAVTVGVFLVVRGFRGRPGEQAASDPVGAVFCSSLLFAAAHSSVWPSPVPLLLLGLVLGYLAYRMQSLVPALVVHALFNGVACVLLFFPQLLGQGPQPEKGSGETSALSRPSAVSTSTEVPGSQWPRRK